MNILTKAISADDAAELLSISETHFLDLKSVDIKPAKLSKTISAFANTSGGEIFVGINEQATIDGKERVWSGFADEEAANGIFQVIQELDPLGGNVSGQFISADGYPGLVLVLTVFKSQSIIAALDGNVYIRRSAQSLKVADAALEALRFDKGVKSFEDEIADVEQEAVTNSEMIIEFLLSTIPTGEPKIWL